MNECVSNYPLALNMLNCRMTPQLRGVPYVSELLQATGYAIANVLRIVVRKDFG